MGNNFKNTVSQEDHYMVKNIITLIVSLCLIIFFASYRVSALREKHINYNYSAYDVENGFLNNIGVDKLRSKFEYKFKIFDDHRIENQNLIKLNYEFNKEIKEKLQQNKESISHEQWKEIRHYKNEINDMKISTIEKLKQLIDDQRENLRNANYSDQALENFVNVLINAQQLKRKSIDFEKTHLQKINDLII